MSIRIIQDRLDEYRCRTEQEEENAVKEIAQEVCLAGLSRSGFFKKALFQGGTCLRILYGLPRFSEDLDFLLREPDPDFKMDSYLAHLKEELTAYGFEFEVQDRSSADSGVKKAFLKDESWGKVLTLRHYRACSSAPKKVSIKIEVDTAPPAGSGFEDKVLDFPFPFTVGAQDLPSLFAGKSHALLCRGYVKGRDWYDFLWYVRKSAKPHFEFLGHALDQQGPWKGKGVQVDSGWYRERMSERIRGIDWQAARRDVQRFLPPAELPSLDLWSADFFLEVLGRVRD